MPRKLDEIFNLVLILKMRISSNFVAFSEYVNFIRFSFIMNRYFDCLMVNTNTQGHSPFNDHTKFCRVRAKCDQIRVLISHDSRKNSIKMLLLGIVYRLSLQPFDEFFFSFPHCLCRFVLNSWDSRKIGAKILNTSSRVIY